MRAFNGVSLIIFKELNRIFWVKDKLRSTTSPWKEDESFVILFFIVNKHYFAIFSLKSAFLRLAYYYRYQPTNNP